MKRETITIADIYVPAKRRGTLEQKRVDEIAASIRDPDGNRIEAVRFLRSRV
jgi:hypothetical protein